MQDDNIAFIKKMLAQVIIKAFKLQPSWTIEEHGIKVGIIMNVQEYMNWYKQPPPLQLEILVGVL